MKYTFTPKGTCSRRIDIDIDESGKILDLAFTGGCHGNLQGIAALARGMKAEDLVARLGGIKCGSKATSCPDQLAEALKAIVAGNPGD